MLQQDTNVRLQNVCKINLTDTAYYVGTIDISHQHVHSGEFYTASYQELAVANNGVVRLRLTAGTNYCHVVATFTAEGKTRVKSYLGTTYTDAGTAPDGTKLTVFNRKTSGGLPTTLIKYNPTVNVLGALRINETIFSGTGPKTTGSTGGDRVETNTAPTHDILIVLTNVSGSAQDIEVQLDWYE